MYSRYPEILQVLSNAIAKETSAGARDNIIGAIARMIITNHSIMPMDQVFPVMMSHLPLREDLEENKTVYKAVLTLYRDGHTILKTHLNALLEVGVQVLNNENTDDGKQI